MEGGTACIIIEKKWSGMSVFGDIEDSFTGE
jgi:hypothetical protein